MNLRSLLCCFRGHSASVDLEQGSNSRSFANSTVSQSNDEPLTNSPSRWQRFKQRVQDGWQRFKRIFCCCYKEQDVIPTAQDIASYPDNYILLRKDLILGDYLFTGPYDTSVEGASNNYGCASDRFGLYFQDAQNPDYLIRVTSEIPAPKNIDTSAKKAFNYKGMVDAYNTLYGQGTAEAYVFDPEKGKSPALTKLIPQLKDQLGTSLVGSVVVLRIKKIEGEPLVELIKNKSPYLPSSLNERLREEYTRIANLGIWVAPTLNHWFYDTDSHILQLVDPIGMNKKLALKELPIMLEDISDELQKLGYIY